MKPAAWHEPNSYGKVTTHKKWALENGWLPLYAAPQPVKEVPEGYALVSIDALKAWGKYDEVRNACQFPAKQAEQEPVATDLMDMLRLIETIKYLRGIAERGLGREIRDDETIEQFVLGYVKQLEAAPVKPVKQEPVAEVVLRNQTVGFGRTEKRKDIVFLADVEVGTKLYAAPVRTKDLTDDEIDAFIDRAWDKQMSMPEIIRAVITADREKNK